MKWVLILIFWIVVYLVVVKWINPEFTLLNKDDYKIEENPKGKLGSAIQALNDHITGNKPKP